MFNTFSGNSRRPRQVNLSGRNPNPFATFGGQNKSPSVTNPLASAQREREARQLERARQKAATNIQRTWRGHSMRMRLSDETRRTWDSLEGNHDEAAMEVDMGAEGPRYMTEAEAMERAKMLLRFVDARQHDDLARLQRLYRRLRTTVELEPTWCQASQWPELYGRLEQACLHALQSPRDGNNHKSLWDIIRFLTARIERRSLKASRAYYMAFASLPEDESLDVGVIAAPLQKIGNHTVEAYQGFIELLFSPTLSERLDGGSLQPLSQRINCKILGAAVAKAIREKTAPFDADVKRPLSSLDCAWLLGHTIYFYREAHAFHDAAFTADLSLVYVISNLLAAVADDFEIEQNALQNNDDDPPKSSAHRRSMPPFVRTQILSLLNQESIGAISSKIEPMSGARQSERTQSSAEIDDDSTQILANYILTLLRLLPRRADEIRMWLYLGSQRLQQQKADRPSVITLFWHATQRTALFSEISRNPRAPIRALQAAQQTNHPFVKEWRIIFLFIELYLFVLKVMDDEEFFAGSRLSTRATSPRQNTLSLSDLESMTIFLKHLGFAMYYHAKDILHEDDERQARDIASLFKHSHSDEAVRKSSEDRSSQGVAGIPGASLDYLKGLVTGLLRAIYERDSRRPFMPKNHWLLDSQFDMTKFIDAVVEEEERRHMVQEEEDEEENQGSQPVVDYSDNIYSSRSNLVGMSRTQRLARLADQEREMKRASRRRYLQAVAPRLEILQNMPFLIPFTTRVKIFRRFVNLDQFKRRHGVVDPEMWRMIMSHNELGMVNPLQRHQAKIRRDHEFEDAYQQFWDLGTALKEPISITFVDRFDQPEAGIDGGGVTKEFLTSVTNGAFAATDRVPLFVENDQNLLYPNPAALEEERELLKLEGVQDGTPEMRGHLTELLQRYEFLGRIIGKCMYEGILVDISFAGFFLLKWALTGGTGSAPQESGYRANLNDLRDLDEGLYQGLIQLKNYPGDVDDFSLNFTVTDMLNIPSPFSGKPASVKTVTHDLRPDGSATSVTNANRLVYISFMARHRLSEQPRRQTAAFLKGLASIVQPSWLSMFNQSELQTLIGGAPAEISVPDLRNNTVYSGVYQIGTDGEEHQSVKHFWDVMTEIDDSDRRKVLKFVTSTPRAPLLGFGSLNPRFSIRDAGEDQARLPSTSTCVNLLKLPRYKTKAMCKEKLLQAVNSKAGFDLS